MKIRPVAGILTQRKPAALCPSCGEALDAVTGVAFGSVIGPTMQPGDYSMCGECGEVLRYDGRFYSKATPEQAAEFLRERPLMRDMRNWIVARRMGVSKTGRPVQ